MSTFGVGILPFSQITLQKVSLAAEEDEVIMIRLEHREKILKDFSLSLLEGSIRQNSSTIEQKKPRTLFLEDGK